MLLNYLSVILRMNSSMEVICKTPGIKQIAKHTMYTNQKAVP